MDTILYQNAPQCKISISDFVHYGKRRLFCLNSRLYNELFDFDMESHFILRICIARYYYKSLGHALRKWFIENELKFLKHKLNDKSKLELLHLLGQLKSVPIYDDRLVPFEYALYVLQNRQGVIINGMVVIQNTSQLVQVIMQGFKTYVEEQLLVLSRATCPFFARDDGRMDDLIDAVLVNLPMYQNVAETQYDFTRSDIERYSKLYFPLCMRRLHETLRDEHHLKFDGRRMFQLFLQGLGLTIDENLKYWQESMAPNTSKARFTQRYAYHIRHNYGLVGKRKVASAYHCTQIISLPNPSGLKCHGCPYKTDAPSTLTHRLQQDVPIRDIEEIVKVAESGQYENACALTLRSKIGYVPKFIMNPKKFFTLAYDADNL